MISAISQWSEKSQHQASPTITQPELKNSFLDTHNQAQAKLSIIHFLRMNRID